LLLLVFEAVSFSERHAGVSMKHWTPYRCRKSYVDFGYARTLYNCEGIVDSDAAACHNGDAATRGLDKPCDCIHAVEALLFTARCKEPVRSRRTDIFQGLQKIRRHVEGTMECNGKRLRQFDQFPSSFNVDRAVRPQDAENNAIGTFSLDEFDVALHALEFWL
jgi:hypothetical protein